VAVQQRDEPGDLLGGLSFTEEEPAPPPLPPRSGAARVLRVLLALAVLAAAGLVGARWVGEQDTRDVLASSSLTYSRVLDAVAAAVDPATLASAAAIAPRGAERLAADLARLEGGGERRDRLAALVEREREVLLALAPLERLADGPLSVWGQAHQRLADAVVAELSARQALVAVDGGADDGLPDTAGVLRHVATTVGPALVEDVQRGAGAVLDGLAAAARTADLRLEAERATGQRAGVAAARDGLGQGTDETVLDAFASALDAVGELSAVTPAQTQQWPGIRSRLGEQLRFVADSDDSLAAGSVRARLPLVLASVDGVVARAAEAHAAWVPVHEAAVAAQAADAETARRHGEAVRAAGQQWALLRADVTALTSRTSPPAGDVVPQLDRLSAAAESLGTELRASSAPPGAEAAASALVDVVEGVSQPLRAAFDELRLAPCQECPAADTAAWRALSRAGEVSGGGWDAAFPAWEQALADAEASIAARELPPPPDL
jgi:hypothetical protein